jgi:sialidase-1
MHEQPFCDQEPVFVSGRDGYDTFRIPALITAPSGAVLAFCEGRRHGMGDSGEINLVLKRSLDGGVTWQPMQLVAEDGPNTVGNPCPVIDRATGTIQLLLTHNLGEDTEAEIVNGTSKGTRRVWVTRSTDEGATWSAPTDLTATTKAPDWTWYATGPGVGLPLRSGRLVIPCDHMVAETMEYRSHVIYSDDHGETWQLGGVVGDGVNECQAIERRDGSLLLNMRNYDRVHANQRALATSADGGLTWSPLTYDAALVEPICQAALLRGPEAPPSTRHRVLFSNPADRERVKMTVRLSYDEGETWPVAKELFAGPSAYSSLAVLPERAIGCLYERGDTHPYETITLARFSLSWLTDGADRIP